MLWKREGGRGGREESRERQIEISRSRPGQAGRTGRVRTRDLVGNPIAICLQKDRPMEIPQVTFEIQTRNREGPKAHTICVYFNRRTSFCLEEILPSLEQTLKFYISTDLNTLHVASDSAWEAGQWPRSRSPSSRSPAGTRSAPGPPPRNSPRIVCAPGSLRFPGALRVIVLPSPAGRREAPVGRGRRRREAATWAGAPGSWGRAPGSGSVRCHLRRGAGGMRGPPRASPGPFLSRRSPAPG